ncbi:hypothetical protein AAFF_G00111570 [Aldrovandia affinis]|uniref:Uncharacterized protein n=1 Tax=Aldrovandia affinis TaxID=143900 RepID=A0AAD7WAJ5_9TELE|nr:hypothetical protein AAFF_G00111570 [Aldrovandia affinis]
MLSGGKRVRIGQQLLQQSCPMMLWEMKRDTDVTFDSGESRRALSLAKWWTGLDAAGLCRETEGSSRLSGCRRGGSAVAKQGSPPLALSLVALMRGSAVTLTLWAEVVL